MSSQWICDRCHNAFRNDLPIAARLEIRAPQKGQEKVLIEDWCEPCLRKMVELLKTDDWDVAYIYERLQLKSIPDETKEQETE